MGIAAMKLAIVFCALTALLSLSARAQGSPSSGIQIETSDAPSFCNDLDCPPYTVEETLDGGIELRSYKAGMWVSTNVAGMFSVATGTGFNRLFQYIGGSNKEGTKIDMTAPVRTSMQPSDGPFRSRFTVSFYLPFSLQDNPPEPSDERVFIEHAEADMYYVTSFGGFASDSVVAQKAKEMMELLSSLGREFDASMYAFAGYDPPFSVPFRHNEVHIRAIIENKQTQSAPSTGDK